MRALWNGKVIAESDATIVIENNHYFPPESVNTALLKESDTTSYCPWKGTASYRSIQIGEEVNKDAAWFYPEPKDAASEIKNYVAFWNGVEVKE